MKKNLTLLELLIAVVIVAILAGVAIPLYRNTIEGSKAKVCSANLQVLQAAVEIYGLENSVLPSSLTQLQPRHIQKAWAQVFRKGNPWLLKAAYFLVDFDNRGLAYAQQGFVDRYLSGSVQYITCPADSTPPEQGGISYGLNSSMINKSFESYQSAQQSNQYYMVVGDCDSATFDALNGLTQRHLESKVFSGVNRFAQFAVIGGQGSLGKARKKVARSSTRSGVDLPTPPVAGFPDVPSQGQ